eukprot:GSA25T00012332001.1
MREFQEEQDGMESPSWLRTGASGASQGLGNIAASTRSGAEQGDVRAVKSAANQDRMGAGDRKGNLGAGAASSDDSRLADKKTTGQPLLVKTKTAGPALAEREQNSGPGAALERTFDHARTNAPPSVDTSNALVQLAQDPPLVPELSRKSTGILKLGENVRRKSFGSASTGSSSYKPNLHGANVILSCDLLNAVATGCSSKIIPLFLVQEYNFGPLGVLSIAFCSNVCAVFVAPYAKNVISWTRNYGYPGKVGVLLVWLFGMFFVFILCLPEPLLSWEVVALAVTLRNAVNGAAKGYLRAKLVGFLPYDKVSRYMSWDSLNKASQGGLTIFGTQLVYYGSYRLCFTLTFLILVLRWLLFLRFILHEHRERLFLGGGGTTGGSSYYYQQSCSVAATPTRSGSGGWCDWLSALFGTRRKSIVDGLPASSADVVDELVATTERKRDESNPNLAIQEDTKAQKQIKDTPTVEIMQRMKQQAALDAAASGGSILESPDQYGDKLTLSYRSNSKANYDRSVVVIQQEPVDGLLTGDDHFSSTGPAKGDDMLLSAQASPPNAGMLLSKSATTNLRSNESSVAEFVMELQDEEEDFRPPRAFLNLEDNIFNTQSSSSTSMPSMAPVSSSDYGGGVEQHTQSSLMSMKNRAAAGAGGSSGFGNVRRSSSPKQDS